MSPEEFIKKHPFPVNGSEINDLLIRMIQNPEFESKKQKNLEKLLENNARLIWVIYQQYNYGETLSSVMSFVYEGLVKASESYNSTIGVPFYNYATQKIRSLLQTNFQYKNDVIHVPVKQKAESTFEYLNLDDYSESISNYEDSELDYNAEIDELILEYKSEYIDDKSALKDLDILILSRDYSQRDIADMLKISRPIISKSINKVINRFNKLK